MQVSEQAWNSTLGNHIVIRLNSNKSTKCDIEVCEVMALVGASSRRFLGRGCGQHLWPLPFASTRSVEPSGNFEIK